LSYSRRPEPALIITANSRQCCTWCAGEPDFAGATVWNSSKKPDRAGWALARVDDELKQTLERERTFAQAAQAHKKGDELREALASYRAAENAVIDAAKAVMKEADMNVNAATERQIRAAVEGRVEDPLEILRRK